MKKDTAQDGKIEKLNHLALQILEKVGIRILSEDYLGILAKKGGNIKGRRIFFSRDTVFQLLGQAPSSFTLHAPNPDHNIQIGQGESKLAVGYGCASIIDAKGNVRDACFRDHLEFVKLVHQSGFFSINGGILAQPSDVAAEKSHLAMHYASLVYSVHHGNAGNTAKDGGSHGTYCPKAGRGGCP